MDEGVAGVDTTTTNHQAIIRALFYALTSIIIPCLAVQLLCKFLARLALSEQVSVPLGRDS